MKNLRQRFKKEAECFDKIARERYKNNQIPDIRKKFVNAYFYNNIWRNSIFLSEEYGPRCKWIIDSLKKAGIRSVIELGSGNGWLSLELAREGFKVTGLDISRESVTIARDYLNSLEGKETISLRYICENILDYKGYSGESIVCFGFLHHLPPQSLKELIQYLSKRMKSNQVLLAVEPRYDYASYELAFLIYALRGVLPNHFHYENVKKDVMLHINEIFAELSESNKNQSEMDNASNSNLIVETIKENFDQVDLQYCTSFFDKIIGSIRVAEKDLPRLSKLLKQLDEIIVKYNYNFSRIVKIRAEKTA